MIDRLRADRGLKKGAKSQFQKDALKWRLFDETVKQVRKAFASLSAVELSDTIDEAILNVRERKGRQAGSRSRK